MTTTGAPAWAHCGQGASASDPVGCIGIVLPSLSTCLAHAAPADRTTFLSSLSPGDNIDLRGTTLTPQLLDDVKAALTDPATSKCRIGTASFDSATFTGNAWFDSATFTGHVSFDSATFTGEAWFALTTFAGDARFDSATFAGDARFDSATFTGDAAFDSATFTGDARFGAASFAGDAAFESATFTGDARFGAASFAGDAWFGSSTFTGYAGFDSASFTGYAGFDSASFAGDAWFGAASFAGYAVFDSAGFERAQRIGPLVCKKVVDFTGARFMGQQVVVEAASVGLLFDNVVFAGTVSVRARYAEVSLSGAVLGGKMALQTHPVPFTTASLPGAVLNEDVLSAGGRSGVRLIRLDAVDASALVLTDIDLSDCAFSGAFHLDQIRLGFGCTFRQPPPGWHRRGLLPARRSRRKTLAEEHHRRALTPGSGGTGWERGPHHPDGARTPDHGDLTEIYQQLRKAFEDGGDEPDAADFYYGEMEMRRHDRARTRGERGLLWAYWLVSGYGLRASRALTCLLVAMAATVLLLLTVGLPDADPVPQTTGTSRAGHVQLATDTPDPALSLPLGERFTTARADKATLVVVNSVVFRSSGQNLTTPGTIVEMLSRISEPVLLGLAALAVRGRVKR
jgi:hypothetical protein